MDNPCTAVIIEPRCHAALSYVIDNVASNLPSWQILIIHGTKNAEFVAAIIEASPFHQRMTAKQYPFDNLSMHDYNALCVSQPLFEDIPTETFLIFQTDSMIISANREKLNQFLQYDYVGAPWDSPPGVGNGGFSLRKKSVFQSIIRQENYPLNVNEDRHFSHYTTNKPSDNAAQEFSIETIFHEAPFACHAPWKWMNPSDIARVFELYPAVKELHSMQHHTPPVTKPSSYVVIRQHMLLAEEIERIGSPMSIILRLYANLCDSAACLTSQGSVSIAYGLQKSLAPKKMWISGSGRGPLDVFSLTISSTMPERPDLVLMENPEIAHDLMIWFQRAVKYIIIICNQRVFTKIFRIHTQITNWRCAQNYQYHDARLFIMERC